MFSVGLVVGAEFGGSEGHHAAEWSQLGDGDDDASKYESDGAESAGDKDPGDIDGADVEGDQGKGDHQRQPDAPKSQAPAETNGP